MTPETVRYRAEELSPDTWVSYERLFSAGNGGDTCCCLWLHGVALAPWQGLRRAERKTPVHATKRALTEQGRAHGVLVFADDEPVGWAAYGRPGELPGFRAGPEAEWVLPCFVVDKRHRRRGVSAFALRAALEAVRRAGGGMVEAHALAGWTHGRGGASTATTVPGAGLVAPAWGSFGGNAWRGTVWMFEREGFRAVGVQPAPRPSARVRESGAEGYVVVMRRRL